MKVKLPRPETRRAKIVPEPAHKKSVSEGWLRGDRSGEALLLSSLLQGIALAMPR